MGKRTVASESVTAEQGIFMDQLDIPILSWWRVET